MSCGLRLGRCLSGKFWGPSVGLEQEAISPAVIGGEVVVRSLPTINPVSPFFRSQGKLGRV